MLDLRFPKVHYLGLDEALVLFERTMLEQTDLQVEAAQSRRFAQNFAHHAYIRTPAHRLPEVFLLARFCLPEAAALRIFA